MGLNPGLYGIFNLSEEKDIDGQNEGIVKEKK
jgi:hypothetical protein